MSPAWKSTEWPIEARLIRVTSKVSPTRPRRVGPMKSPLYVHARSATPGATSRVCSVTVRVIRWITPPVPFGSSPSTAAGSSTAERVR